MHPADQPSFHPVFVSSSYVSVVANRQTFVLVVVPVTSLRFSLDDDPTDFSIVDAVINLGYDSDFCLLAIDPATVSTFVRMSDRYFYVVSFVAINPAIVLASFSVINLYLVWICALEIVYSVAISLAYVLIAFWAIDPDSV